MYLKPTNDCNFKKIYNKSNHTVIGTQQSPGNIAVGNLISSDSTKIKEKVWKL